MSKTKVTIDDIARRAGVSKTSVSFAFNRPERLSETTLDRILRVAEELGYNPDPLASNLKTGRTGCIGLLVPQPIPVVTGNPHIAEFMEGIGQVCHEAGLSLMLVPPLQGNLHRAVVRAAVDGFLALGVESFKEAVAVLQQQRVPCVMVDSEPAAGIPCVNIDDEAGAYKIMSYVLRRGHREIAVFSMETDYRGESQMYTGLTRRRMNGYVRALDEIGLFIDQRRVRLTECQATIQAGHQAFMTLWRSGWRPSIVVAMADVLALGALQAIHELKLESPETVSVVGYDDIRGSVITCPPLTTVRQPTLEKGRIATRLLLDQIEGHTPESDYVLLPVEFIERQSVRVIE
jgi:alanine racemase